MSRKLLRALQSRFFKSPKASALRLQHFHASLEPLEHRMLLTVIAPSNLVATAASVSQINLAWVDNSANETGFEIDRATNSTFSAGLTSFTAAANATTFASTALTTDNTYYYRVRSTIGGTDDSANTLWDSATTLSSANAPAWQDYDLNGATPAGSGTLSGGVWTIVGGGTGCGTSDNLHFTAQPWSGGASMQVKITSLSGGADWGGVGLMIRESSAANSKSVFLPVANNNHGAGLYYRPTAGAAQTAAGTASTPNPTASTPVWLRLTRTGDVFTGYYSTDGQNWNLIGSATVSMNASVLVGMAATANSAAQSITGTMTDATFAPAAPVSLGATAASSSQINLSWSDTSGNETGFEIDRATNSDFAGTSLATFTAAANATSFASTGLAFGSTYYYRVRATIDGGNDSPASNLAYASVGLTDYNLSGATPAGSSSYAAGIWTITGGGTGCGGTADSTYLGAQSWTGGAFMQVKITSISGGADWSGAGLMIRESSTANAKTAFLVVGNGHGSGFYYRNATGGSMATQSTAATSDPTPAAPLWIRLTRSGDTFTAYYSTNGVDFTTMGSVSVSMNASVLMGLAACGQGSTLTATMTDVTLAPPAPSSLAATVASDSQINLTWTDNSSNEGWFEIDRATSSDFSAGLTTFTAAANATSYASTGLAGGTAYYYRVRSTISGGSGDDSPSTSTVNATTLPVAPTSLAATSVSNSRIDLSWTDNSSNETGFEIDRATNSTFSAGLTTLTAAAGATSYASTGLATGTTYYYRVRSTIGGSNDSTNSASASAATSSSGWTGYDLNGATPAGSEQLTAGAWTITGGGTGCGTTDNLHLTAQSWTGGAFMQVRVTSISGGADWSGMGLMIRETSAANSKSVYLALGSVHGVGFYYRTTAGGAQTGPGQFSAPNPTVTNPVWLRLTRSGDLFTGYFSTDGTNWTAIGSQTISMSSSVLMGMVACGQSSTQTLTTTMDNVVFAPQEPSNLSATTYSASQINLTWTDASANETGFEIDRATNSTFSAGLTTLTAAANATSYASTGLAGGTVYYYRIRATIGGTDDSPNTATASAATSAAAPTAPTGLGATAVSNSQINLAWTDASANETGFEIDRATNSTFSAGLTTFTAAANATSYASTGLAASTTYYYRVRSTIGGSNDSTNSSSANATTTAAAPNAPTGLGATPYSSSQINLAWTDTSGNETGFEIDRATNSDFSAGLTTLTAAAGATTYASTGLAGGTAYYYRVRSTISGTNDSTNSNMATATTNTAAPTAPSGLGATVISSSQINLAWTDASGNETGFEIDQATNSTFSVGLTTFTAAANATSFASTGLAAATAYYYRVRSTIGGTNDSANSASANATTQSETWTDYHLHGATGSGTLASGTWTVAGGGTGNGTYDDVFLKAQSWTGGAFMQVKITSLAGGADWSGGGLMIRESSADNAKTVYLPLSNNHGTGLYYRSTAGAALTGVGQFSAPNPTATNPVWLRLTRSGDLFSGFFSINGTDWTAMGSVSVSMSSSVLIGMVACGQSGGQTLTATMSDVVFAPSECTNVSATTVSTTQINLAWTDTAGNETGYEIDRATDSGFTAGLTTLTAAANATSYASTGLTAGTTYYYRVRSTIGGTNDSPQSATFSATTAPTAPTSLTATSVSSSQIDLAWTDNSNETGFEIDRATNSTFSAGLTTLATTAINATSYASTGLSAGMTYYYRVRATIGGSNDSTATAEAHATTQANAWADAEINGSTPGGSTTVNGNVWTIVGGGVGCGTTDTLHFRAEPWTTGNAFMQVKITDISGGAEWSGVGLMVRQSTAADAKTVFLVADPTHGVGFYYRNAVGASLTGSGGYPLAAPPTAQAPLWIRMARNGDTFSGYLSTDGVNWTGLGSTTVSMTSTVQIGIAACAQSSVQTISTTMTDLVFAPLDAQQAPTLLSAAAASGSQINLAWQDNSDYETGFKVDCSTTSNFAAVTTFTAAANATSYPSTSLNPNVTYYYRVWSTCAGVDSTTSSNSANATTTTVTPPTTPTIGTPAVVGMNQINVIWTDVGNENWYEIDVAGNSSFTGASTFTSAGNTTLYPAVGLVAGTTYYFRVRSVIDSSNKSNPSGTVSATTQAAGGARVFYIDYVNGSDSNNGTSKATPWKRQPFMKGFAGSYTHQAGDDFIFKGGVTWPVGCFQMLVTAGGASDANRDLYTVDSTWYAGGSYTKPVFDFQHTLVGSWGEGAAGVRVLGSSYITFDGLELANHESLVGWGCSTICLSNSSHITVTNSLIHGWDMYDLNVAGAPGSGGAIIRVGDGGYNVISYTEMHQVGITEPSGIAVWNIGEISHCTIHDTACGIQSAQLVHDSAIYNLRNPTLTPNNPTPHINGILAFTPIVIYNNVIHDTDSFCMPIFLDPAWSGYGYDLVYNNVVYNVAQPCISVGINGSIATAAASGSHIFNNTLSSGDGGACIAVGESSTPVPGRNLGVLDVQNNHFITEIYGIYYAINPPKVNSLTVNNNVTQTHTVAASAGYTANNSFRPTQTNSATVNAGVNLSTWGFNADRLGVGRGTTWDAGAYEYSAGMRAAGGVMTGRDVDALTQQALQTIVYAAMARWEATGVDAARFQNVEWTIIDLAGDLLAATSGSQIFIDVDAAGYGWFTDVRRPNGKAGSGMDLLTVVSHELGHTLGLEHQATGVMSESLAEGQRLLPTTRDAAMLEELWRDSDSDDESEEDAIAGLTSSLAVARHFPRL